MENPRTAAARGNDDSEVIDAAGEAPSQGGRSGGTMAGDVATRDELDAIADPEGRTRVTKSNAIDHDQDERSAGARAHDAGGRENEPPDTVG